MLTKPDLALSAPEQRRLCSDFVTRCAITALAGRLPLRWPTPPQTPPSPKSRYRSHYQPPDPGKLLHMDNAAWATIRPFDLLLLLIDFSGLRPVLAQKLYRASRRGRAPFDPISLFLVFGWQLINRWGRTEMLAHLAEDRYADYAAAFGFQKDLYPTEGGLRYFLTTLGEHNLTALLVQSMTLIQQAGFIPAEVQRKAIISFDGMIHDAASRMRCSAIQQSCYQPTLPAPTLPTLYVSGPETPRPCPAKEKGQRGCSCETMACRQQCRQAPSRDPDARYVWYSGSNRTDHPNATIKAEGVPAPSVRVQQQPEGSAPPKSPQGEGHYGYRSLPAELVDHVQRTTWVLAAADLAPANGHEEKPAAQVLQEVATQYPWLHPYAAIGDSGLGYEPFLAVAYDLGVRRVVDLRADPRSDRDKDGWAMRGYDDKGWPVCPFGYRLHPNGYDEARHRSKWCCRQRCEEPADDGENTSSVPPDCPYRDRTNHPFGSVKNVGKTFDDGSMRLLRDVPYGSSAWKELYRRGRNGAEGRNAALERWGLKRLPVFGTPRGQATVFLADVWLNLMTMARLMKEATLAQIGQPEVAA